MDIYDEIAAAAYGLFESRGCVHGCGLDDGSMQRGLYWAITPGRRMKNPKRNTFQRKRLP